MDTLRQSASTSAGRHECIMEETTTMSPEKAVSSAHARPASAQRLTSPAKNIKLKEPLPLRLRIGSTDSYSETQSTAPSSCADSSGETSPVSASTATSHFLDFDFEEDQQDQSEYDGASQLRKRSLPLHHELRGRPPLVRASSFTLNAETKLAVRSMYKASMPSPSRRKRDSSPRRPTYTFPFRSAKGWSMPTSPDHPASAPGSAPGSRRDSMQSALLKSRVATGELMYSDAVNGPSDEPQQLSDDTMSTLDPLPPQTTDPGIEAVLSPEAFEGASNADPMADQEMPLPQRPGQNQTEDICDLILNQVFRVDLQDLTYATDALESVGRCLEELSNLVHSCRPIRSTLPFCDPSDQEPKTQSQPQVRNVASGDNEGRPGRSRKRTSSRGNSRERDDEDYDGRRDDSGGKGGSTLIAKRIRVEPPDNRHPCPYRKRNPLKFNVRDYNTCATSCFSDLPNLKRHIKFYHRRQASLPHVCPRCRVNQETRDQLNSHLQLPSELLCPVQHESRSNDPEEGITPSVEDMLNARTSTARINTWPSLCQALFPEDADVLSSVFEPPVELDEVSHEFEGTRDELRNRIQLETKSISELSPAAQVYVADHMELASWDYIQNVLSASRLHADHNTERHHKRRRSQKSSTASLQSHGLLSPVAPRQILPKTSSSAPGMAGFSSTGSSLSSSWETAISNQFSAQLHSVSSSSSLTIPLEQQVKTGQDECFHPSLLPGSTQMDGTVEGDVLDPAFGKGTVGWQELSFATEHEPPSAPSMSSYVQDFESEDFTQQEGFDNIVVDEYSRDAHGDLYEGGDMSFYPSNFDDAYRAPS